MPDQIVETVALAQLPVAALVVEAGLVRAVNPAAETLLDRPAEELVGLGLAELFDPADRAEVVLALALVRPVSARLADSGHPVELALSAVADGQLVVVHDRRAERRLTRILDAVADSTLLLDGDGRLLWQSEVLASRVPDEVNLGSHPVERIHPEDLPVILEAFAALDRLPGKRARHVVRSMAVDDNSLWQLIEVIGASRLDDPDLGGVVVQVRNLDEGSTLESLGETQGPLLSLAEAAPVGIVLMDGQGHTVFANRVSRDLLAVPGADVDRWRERVGEAHQPTLDALVDAAVRGEDTASSTISFQTPQGASGWLRMRVVPHRGPAGTVAGVIVTLEDVTAEVEVRAESERLLHMLDMTLDFVLIFRPDGEILHTNAALRQVLDRLWAEGGSGRLVDLLGPAATERLVASAPSVLDGGDTWQGELLVNVGGGAQVPVSVLGMVARDETGAMEWIAMVARDITELKEAEARLRRTATFDHLTGLANRALLTEELTVAVARAGATGRAVAVLFCDLDRFKEVNDRFGHRAGDAVVATVADRLRDITREGDLAARVGGDEFVVLCEGLGDADALAGLAERIIASVQRPITADGDEVSVGISIGVALAHHGGVDGDRLLLAADQAMYRAKATGGNRYRITEIDA